MSKIPLVSICIPTYRGAAHLPAAIESVLQQTLQDWELVIIDDHSPDETSEVVARYGDARIRYIRNEQNLGPEGNWNRCLQEARGRYFKLLPQDDLLYPEALLSQVQVLNQDRDERIALVFGARNIIDAQGRVLARRGYPGNSEGLVSGEALIRSCVRYGTNLVGEPGSVLMRKSLADRVGSFDADIPYVIDLDYWARLLSHGDAYYFDRIVSAFRVSGGSWSVAIGARQSEEYRRFMTKLKANARWRISRLDMLVGNNMARLNNLLRLLFYRVTLR